MTFLAIILTAEQASPLCGTYHNIAALEPVPIGDGRYFLPLAVLEDANFAEVKPILESLPQEEITVTQEEAPDA